MPEAVLRVSRGTLRDGEHFVDYRVPAEEGMVVLDALHWIQAHAAPDLAVRWNCKAAKCGSCSAEVNGRPVLTCKTRMSDFAEGEPIVVEPIRTFPLIKDLVTDVSWNYEVNKLIVPFTPPDDVPQEQWRWQQRDIERVQEMRKCIECFLCQDVCHVLRNHETEQLFMGPRFLVRVAALEMHPMDRADRTAYLKDEGGIGYCNITKCCTEVCPEHIKITDNAIIPLKERVADRYYDPIQMFWRKLTGAFRGAPREPVGLEAPAATAAAGDAAAPVRPFAAHPADAARPIEAPARHPRIGAAGDGRTAAKPQASRKPAATAPAEDTGRTAEKPTEARASPEGRMRARR